MAKNNTPENDSAESGKATEVGVYFDTTEEKFTAFKTNLAAAGLSRKEFLNDMIDFFNKHGETEIYKRLEIEKMPF